MRLRYRHLRLGGVVSGACLSLLLIPGGAAATITVHVDGDSLEPGLELRGNPGANRVRMRLELGEGVEIRSPEPIVTTGVGCDPIPGGVRCAEALASDHNVIYALLGGGRDRLLLDETLNGIAFLNIYMGRGADRLGAGGVDGKYSGGRGADRLVGWGSLDGGGAGDELIGGRRSDFMAGGPGNDELRGGRGDDELRGDRGRDLLNGGPGSDFGGGGPGRNVLIGIERFP